jgi:hypothetical protein
MMMNVRKLVAATAVVAVGIGVGVWRTHAGTPSSFIVGPLRVVGVRADTTGSITARQAVAEIAAKLAEMEPNVTWDTAIQPTWSVQSITNMTQVYDSTDGHLLYTRSRPINAVVASLHHGSSWVFGIVSTSTFTPVTCSGDGCDPPGTPRRPGVHYAVVEAITKKLDTDFFAGRWARATDRQRELLMVMAGLDKPEGEFTVQEIVARSAAVLPKAFSSSHANQMLVSLCDAGLVYKNRHGRYSFAVPLFDQFIARQLELQTAESQATA